ncbi:MAG TPA: glycosyltransferase family 4 protein [Trinickia sp.]|jgi:glycosyltransferase involved in cell wall biosynthesis|uniref:glycosyltransferase family 4 protein n=1 Tax=Trinickia sp. TaxID=2571163 RepID=UPI002BA09069|nr:glycosyltransferase family 4 protein [Trinickia sp.]HTI18899.1 glycosyltransferase family 4 protein [Trinickia sp.]
MQIAIFSRVLPHHSIGGMQAVAWDLARAFVRSGHQVTVVTAELPGRPHTFEDEGVRIIALSGVPWQRYGAGWWRGSRRVFEQLASSCEAVLSVSAAANALLQLRTHYAHIPFVMQAHGTSMGEVLSKWRTRTPRNWLSSLRNIGWIFNDLRAYRRYDTVVAVGERVEADMLSAPIRWALPGERVQLISNGIDTTMFRSNPQSRQRLLKMLGWDDSVRVVVSASRLHKQKGVDLSLNAVSLLAQRVDHVRYLVVGDGPERSALEEHAARLGLRDKVHFTGGVAREALLEYLQAADVMLFTTTRVEGLPLNMLEALAVGLPCVVSRGVLDEAMFGSHVSSVPPHDADAVASALDRALTIGVLPEGALPTTFSLAACVEAYLGLFCTLSARRTKTISMAQEHA